MSSVLCSPHRFFHLHKIWGPLAPPNNMSLPTSKSFLITPGVLSSYPIPLSGLRLWAIGFCFTSRLLRAEGNDTDTDCCHKHVGISRLGRPWTLLPFPSATPSLQQMFTNLLNHLIYCLSPQKKSKPTTPEVHPLPAPLLSEEIAHK